MVVVVFMVCLCVLGEFEFLCDMYVSRFDRIIIVEVFWKSMRVYFVSFGLIDFVLC